MTNTDFDTLWSYLRCQYVAWATPAMRDVVHDRLHGFTYDVAYDALKKWMGDNSRSAKPCIKTITHMCFDAVTRVSDEPGAWTWQDENDLRHMLRDAKRMIDAGRNLDACYLDEGWVCRNRIGKNPSREERTEAQRMLGKHWTEAVERIVSRGASHAEAEAVMRSAI